jgi:hypothetical protein
VDQVKKISQQQLWLQKKEDLEHGMWAGSVRGFVR